MSFAGWTLYQSVILEPMDHKRGVISQHTPKQINILKSATSPLVAKKEQGCDEYLQAISAISQGLASIRVIILVALIFHVTKGEVTGNKFQQKKEIRLIQR